MGHLRLGRLPRSRPWKAVIHLLGSGAGVPELAAATALAAENELRAARGDPALAHAIYILAQLPLIARSGRFAENLLALGFDASAGESLISLAGGVSRALDRNAGPAMGSDFGVLVRQAASETIAAVVGRNTPSLFGDGAEQTSHILAGFANRTGFASLAREFFARLTQKTLEHYLSRELPKHVGPRGRFVSIDSQMEFREALERHCRETALIVRDFAGGWFSKALYEERLTPRAAGAFGDYALKKLRDELRMRGAAHG